MPGTFSLYLQVRYTILPDDTQQLGVLRCITPASIVFLTKHEMITGEYLRLCISSMEEGDQHSLPPAFALVRHVEMVGGYYQTGADFCKEPAPGFLENHRTHERHSCHMQGHYTRGNTTHKHPAELLDLSQNGCRLKLREPLKVPGVITLHMQSAPQSPVQKILDAQVEVIRCHHRGASVYEAGCQFLQANLTNNDPDKTMIEERA